MTDNQQSNPKSLNHIDKNLRALVETQYQFCLYKCTETTHVGQAACKEKCVTDVIVPYRFMNHAGRDQEDNLYRKCLSQKFPNITPDDYQECTH